MSSFVLMILKSIGVSIIKAFLEVILTVSKDTKTIKKLMLLGSEALVKTTKTQYDDKAHAAIKKLLDEEGDDNGKYPS